MGIDTGFASNGFADDRQVRDVFNKLAQKTEEISTDNVATDSDIDGKIDVDEDLQVYNADMKEMSMNSVKKTKKQGKTFLQRNKRQIFDALIILGVVYMAYYLFWDKEDGMEFEEGGDVDYTPAPQNPPAPAPVQAPPPPPRPEMPEPTYNGQ